ncbi:putative transmembrane domain-containing protein [Cryptosporidium canis]|uniref:Transmembrane domain-containing protein n=1 Tax=Cryptosporidium canis TaxID=195482 RepID=A0ABQ8P5P2_9CRYT|nr:putative transmembrane domain-containing protein [Cryptosporidium canis]
MPGSWRTGSGMQGRGGTATSIWICVMDSLLLYMDSDTMFSRFSVKIEDFQTAMRSSYLCMSVDDSCEFQHYIVNVGVLLLSLRRLETFMFCIQVLALQKFQSLLPYSLEWSRSGLNDQNIVISLLNETGRLDIPRIQSYCLNRKQHPDGLFEDSWVDLNLSRRSKGVMVVPSLFLNHIIRVDKVMESSKETSDLAKKAWILHFSGSSRLEQCFMIHRICQERLGVLGDSQSSHTRECPEKLEELMTERESQKVDTLFSVNMSSHLDPNNYIGQHHSDWIESLRLIDLGIKSLSNRYTALINRYVELLETSWSSEEPPSRSPPSYSLSSNCLN